MRFFTLLLILIVTVLLITNISCKSKAKTAGEANKSETVKNPEDENKDKVKPTNQTIRRCGFKFDKTASSDESIVKTVFESMAPALLDKQCSELVALRFGEADKSVWITPNKVFNYSNLSTEVFDENEALNRMEMGCKARPKCREERLRKEQKAFNDSKAAKNKEVLEKQQQVINQLLEFLSAPPAAAAMCSDLNQLRDRLKSDRHEKNIVFSDFLHDCETPIVAGGFTRDIKILVLILPLLNEKTGPTLEERKKNAEQLFNGADVIIVPAASANTEIFNKFLE